MGKPNGNEEGIGWVISALTPEGSQKSNYLVPLSERRRWFHNDFKVRYCSKCEQVWDWHRLSNWVNVMYHKGFPKYGLKTETCYACDPSSYKGSNKKIRVKPL